MDALFSRYACPYELLDTVIESRRLASFIATFWRQRTDDQLYQMWLHKCWTNISFDEFKAKVTQPIARKPTSRQIEATVQDSIAILDSFNPEGVST